MPEKIELGTDSIELVFDTDVKAVAQSDFDQAVIIADGIIAKTRELKDPYHALEAIRQMDRLRNLVGISKAKVLHFLNKYWEEFQINESFMEVVLAYSGLTNRVVIKRYIQIWNMFDQKLIPEEFVDEIKQKPINDLTPIMGALVSGYELSNEDWKEIAERKGNSDISNYIRTQVKNVEPISRAITYVLDKIDGTLYAITYGHKYAIGKITLKNVDEPARRAITRLIETMNIQIANESEQ